jgi:four helix bundle protein
MAAHSYSELRAWQSARLFKLAIYRLIAEKPLARDVRLCEQLRESARSAVSHVAEGYGRFYPADFARFLGMAKASIIEAQTIYKMPSIWSTFQRSSEQNITGSPMLRCATLRL